jgi:hypothetical protein
MAAAVVEQNAAHKLGRNSQKLTPVFPLNCALLN